MKKLVSKNPVLRFKLGKKIPKAFNGLKFLYDTYNYYVNPIFEDWGLLEESQKRAKKTVETLRRLRETPYLDALLKQYNPPKPEVKPKVKTVVKYVNSPLQKTMVNNPVTPTVLKLEITNPFAEADAAYERSKNNVIYPFSGKTLPDPREYFGYYSNGTYHLDNPKWIKKAGIKDLTSLLDYINTNPNSNLALDILHYGGLELLEKDAGISGHYGRRDRKRLNNFLSGLSQGFRDGYMDRVRAFDKQYDLYKSGGTLVSRNPVIRFKNGSSFGKAFRQARNQGLKEFTWNGKLYTTKLKEEVELKNSDNISDKLLYTKMKQDIYNDSTNGNYEKGIRTFYSPSGRKAEIIRKKPILTHY